MNRTLRTLSTHLKAGLWYAPAAILVLLVFTYPIFRTLSLTFMHFNLETGFHPRFAGLDNLIRLAADSRFLGSLRVTAVFTVLSVAMEFLLGLLSALAVERIRRGRRIARTLLLLPWALPTAVIAVLWIWIFNDQYGAVNALLLKIKAIHSPIPWLGNPSSALLAIVLADVWKSFPFVFVVLLAGIQSIPQEMYEAIEVDGGTSRHKFRYVTLPYLKPFVFLALIFRVVQAFAVFDLVYVLTGGGPGGATETVSVYGYYVFMRYLDFGYGSALVIVVVGLLALVAWMLYMMLLRKHELAG